jgi:hypothetical protein
MRRNGVAGRTRANGIPFLTSAVAPPVSAPGGVPIVNLRSGTGQALPVRSEVRLRMKGNPTAPGLDGAWWPRSLQPETEFPELALVVSSWVGPVCRVIYRTDEWNAAGNAASSDGWPFDLEGSGAVQRNTVVVVGTHQRRRTLLVVPPAAPGRVARAVLSATAGPGTVVNAEHTLAGHGIRSALHSVADMHTSTQRTYGFDELDRTGDPEAGQGAR